MSTTSLAQQINLRASQKNIPLSVLVEITYTCNHHCFYCYQTEYPDVEDLSFTEWCTILQQLADEGTLYLTFSGGEPFTRSDFLPIVAAARSLGFGISIITNGTLLTRQTIRMLAAMGIMDIGISLLAADEQLHDQLTGKKGSFVKAIKSVDECIAAGIKTIIKHTVSTANYGEFEKLDKLAGEAGALFECDCFTVPSHHGAVSPYALSPMEYLLYLEKMRATPLVWYSEEEQSAQLHCDAGRSVAGITPGGMVVPCIMLPTPLGSLKESTFASLWNSPAAKQFRAEENRLSHECCSCEIRHYCSRCHGIAYAESGSWRGKSESLCLHAAAMKRLSEATTEW